MSIGGGSHGSRAYGSSPTWDRLFGEISRGFDLVGLRPARLRIVSTVVGRAATLLWREMQGRSKTFRRISYVGVAVLKKAIVLPTSFELIVRAHRYRFRNRACASSSQMHRVICAQRTAFIQDTLWSPRRQPTCEIGNPPIFHRPIYCPSLIKSRTRVTRTTSRSLKGKCLSSQPQQPKLLRI